MSSTDQQRERTATVYYDAQANFGTPPKEGSGDYKMGMRKASGSERGAEDALYERVHTERRHPSTTYQSPLRPTQRDIPIRQQTPERSVIHHQIRSPTGPVLMAPISSSYDYSIGSTATPSAFRAQSGADEQQKIGNRWKQQRDVEDFKPGPRASSAANIDALFAQKKPRSQSSSGVIPPPSSRTGYSNEMNLVFTRRNNAVEPSTPTARMQMHHHQQQQQQMQNKDFGVVGAYSTDASLRADQIMYGGSRQQHGSVRQHSNDYELDPRLNVTYPQFYVDDWKERHHPRETTASPGASGYPRAPRQSPSFSTAATNHQQPTGRPRFASDANSRHLYEEVPMSSSPIPHNGYRSPATAYGRNEGVTAKETAILDDYDNVPSEFLVQEQPRGKTRDEGSNADGESGIYQPGRYQPC